LVQGRIRNVVWLRHYPVICEVKPTKYWLATVDRKMSYRRLVDLAKMRWRIERDYEDLKQEIGLGHCEGRGWRGFHQGSGCQRAAGGEAENKRGDRRPLLDCR
jgi:SRSO17 transposase